MGNKKLFAKFWNIEIYGVRNSSIFDTSWKSDFIVSRVKLSLKQWKNLLNMLNIFEIDGHFLYLIISGQEGFHTLNIKIPHNQHWKWLYTFWIKLSWPFKWHHKLGVWNQKIYSTFWKILKAIYLEDFQFLTKFMIEC